MVDPDPLVDPDQDMVQEASGQVVGPQVHHQVVEHFLQGKSWVEQNVVGLGGA